MYVNQCVPFMGCKLTIPIALENGSSLKKIPTLSNPIEQRTCCIFLFDAA